MALKCNVDPTTRCSHPQTSDPNTVSLLLPHIGKLRGHHSLAQVDFDTTLDMAPYMSDRRCSPKLYQLYGVLVHQGHSVHSGHYYCFVRAANGLWHQMNDNTVSQVLLCFLTIM